MANNPDKDVIWLCGSPQARQAAQPLIKVLAERASCLTLGKGGHPVPDLELGNGADLADALDACPLELRPRACVWLGGEQEPPPQGLEAMPCPVLGWGGPGLEGGLPPEAGQAAAAVCAAAREGLGLDWLPRVQVNLPLRELLGRHRNLAEAAPRLNLEVGLDFLALDGLGEADLDQAAALVAGRRVTVHLPFGDLVPGSPDPKVRKLARGRLTQAGEWAQRLGAVQAVMHTGYDARLHRPDQEYAQRMADNLAPFLELLAHFGCRLALENTFEPEPAPLLAFQRALAQRAAPGMVGFCLDVGHVLAFASARLPVWWAALSPHLLEMHLHDNPGHSDDHLPPGAGVVDWSFLRQRLADLPDQPILTLEPHREGDLWASLRALSRIWGQPRD